jgi:hypothetical protein
LADLDHSDHVQAAIELAKLTDEVGRKASQRLAGDVAGTRPA